MPPGGLGRVAQVELVLHEEVPDRAGVVQHVLGCDGVVVEVVVDVLVVQHQRRRALL